MSVITATITSGSGNTLMDPSYELLSIEIVKEVNRIPYAEIVLADGNPSKQEFPISDTDFFEPGKLITIKLRYESEGKDTLVFKGVVVGQGLSATRSGSQLRVQLKDQAMKMTLARKSAVYTEKTDDKILKDIITKAGLTAGKIEATKPKHDPKEKQQLVQYYSTDWDFILSRAEANGLIVVVNDGEVSLQKATLSGSADHSYEFGIDSIYTFDVDADAQQQVPDVQGTAWDIKTQKPTAPVTGAPFALKQGNLKGDQIAKTLKNDSLILNSPVPLDPKEVQAWVDGATLRTRLSMMRGFISVPGQADILPFNLLELKGFGQRFNGTTLITGVRHSVDENGWQTDVQFGLSTEPFKTQPDIVDVGAAGLVPAVNGLQIGIVADFEADPAKEYRVKVILPGIDEKLGAVWARLATPDAGLERGFFFMPEKGDEVVVGFFNDDPRQPVILGAMFSSKNKLPAAIPPPDKDNKMKGIVTKQGSQFIFLDDKKSEILIQTPEENYIGISDDQQGIFLVDQHGNEITMNKDGITIKSAKDINIEASGNVTIKGSKVDVK